MSLLLTIKMRFSHQSYLKSLVQVQADKIAYYAKSAVVLSLTAVSSVLLTRIDQLMIYHFIDSDALAMYALSIRFVDVLNLVQVTIGTHIFISLAKQSSETLKLQCEKLLQNCSFYSDYYGCFSNFNCGITSFYIWQ